MPVANLIFLMLVISVAFLPKSVLSAGCCFAYISQPLQGFTSILPSFRIVLTASSQAAVNSPHMAYRARIEFPQGFLLTSLPSGCTALSLDTATCTAMGMSQLVKDFTTVQINAPRRGRRQPMIESVVINGEICTHQNSCPILIPTRTTTTTMTRTITTMTRTTSLIRTTTTSRSLVNTTRTTSLVSTTSLSTSTASSATHTSSATSATFASSTSISATPSSNSSSTATVLPPGVVVNTADTNHTALIVGLTLGLIILLLLALLFWLLRRSRKSQMSPYALDPTSGQKGQEAVGSNPASNAEYGTAAAVVSAGGARPSSGGEETGEQQSRPPQRSSFRAAQAAMMGFFRRESQRYGGRVRRKTAQVDEIQPAQVYRLSRPRDDDPGYLGYQPTDPLSPNNPNLDGSGYYNNEEGRGYGVATDRPPLHQVSSADSTSSSKRRRFSWMMMGGRSSVAPAPQSVIASSRGQSGVQSQSPMTRLTQYPLSTAEPARPPKSAYRPPSRARAAGDILSLQPDVQREQLLLQRIRLLQQEQALAYRQQRNSQISYDNALQQQQYPSNTSDSRRTPAISGYLRGETTPEPSPLPQPLPPLLPPPLYPQPPPPNLPPPLPPTSSSMQDVQPTSTNAARTITSPATRLAAGDASQTRYAQPIYIQGGQKPVPTTRLNHGLYGYM